MPEPSPLKEIFLAASEIADAEERRHFLDRACGANSVLRHRIEVLLGSQPSDDFLNAPASGAPSAMAAAWPDLGSSIGYFGDYMLLSEVARGGTGVVFRARQVSLQRVVALKMLRDGVLLQSAADLRRFQAEAEAAASLDHPGIVPIYEIGRHEGQAYYSMKLIEGGTLVFRAAEFRDPRKAAALISKVARAVHSAHGRGILHRDLKPGNILIDGNGEPHVTDFGIARRLDVESGLTHTGQIVGTPHYMAPEQARGENRSLTPAADIYSLGAILYELLSGAKLFDADSMLALLKLVAEAPPPPLRACDRDLGRIVMHCLEKSPLSRYASAADLADDLDRWLRGEPIQARPVPAVVRVIKWARRQPFAAAWVGTLVLVIGWIVLQSRQPVRGEDAGRAGGASVARAVPAPEDREPTPEALEISAGDAAANRRAAEWFMQVIGSSGELHLRFANGAKTSLVRGGRLPSRDYVIDSYFLDRFIGSGDIDVTEADFVDRMRGLTHLTKVYFRSHPLPGGAFAFLAANPSLTFVQFENMPVDDGVLTHLAGLKNLQDLRVVNTRDLNVSFTAEGLAGLACLPVLEELSLYNTDTTDDHVECLRNCPNLFKLDLLRTSVTDRCTAAIATCRKLSRLDLSQTGVTDAGLARFHSLTQLREILISETQVTEAGIAAFRAAVPGCRVSW